MNRVRSNGSCLGGPLGQFGLIVALVEDEPAASERPEIDVGIHRYVPSVEVTNTPFRPGSPRMWVSPFIHPGPIASPSLLPSKPSLSVLS